MEFTRYIEKLEVSSSPDKKLLAAFVSRMPSKEADDLLVDFIGHCMAKRLDEQRENGFSGWNNSSCTNYNLKQRLLNNVNQHDWIDVINLAAMILAREKIFIEVPLVPKGD